MKTSILFALSAFVCGTCVAQHRTEKLWETEALLKVPESVLHAGKVLFVSNVDGKDPWIKDGKGSIARLGLDGNVFEVEWVTGLHAPKGMGLFGDVLYVADLDQVAVIDVAKAVISKQIPIEGAKGLNDITIDAKGVVFVSDMLTGKVHRIENGVVTTFLEGLSRPNGVFVEGDELFVLDNGGLYSVRKDGKLVLITDGLEGGTDGVERADEKGFLVSCWEGALWYVNADGTKQLLVDTRAMEKNIADIGFNRQEHIVYVPTFWKNTVVAYRFIP